MSVQQVNDIAQINQLQIVKEPEVPANEQEARNDIAQINQLDASQEQPADQPQQQPEPQQPLVQQTQISPEELRYQARNFKELREQASRAERERDELLQRLQQIESTKQAAVPEEPEISLGNDDVAEGKHLKQMYKEIKKLKGELQNFQQQSTQLTTEARLKAQYTDFDTIVTRDNIETLRDLDPVEAAAINANPDLFSKAVLTYKAIKRAGIAQQAPTYDKEREKVLANAAKPRPLTSISPQQGESPLSRANAFANGLTPELQKTLLKEMENSRKNL